MLVLSTALAGLLLAYLLSNMFWRKKLELRGKHVVITGGSSGIGLAIAEELSKLGAQVTIFARSRPKLDAALKQIDEASPDPRAQCFPVDVTNPQQLEGAVKQAEAEFGPIDVLVTCAGAAHPGRFLEQELNTFQRDMQLNYFGTLHALKIVLPGMVHRRSGHVLMLTSVCAAIGFAGYSTYAPTKFALRGLADTLRNELAGSGVQLHVAYPMDTETPGYAEENRTKPPECHAISRISGEGNVFTPQQAAATIIRGLRKGAYNISTPDFGSNLLISQTMSSLTPRMFPMLVELLLAPFAIIGAAIFRYMIDREVIKLRKKGLIGDP